MRWMSTRRYRSLLFLFGGPVMGFAGRIAAPAIERIVQRDPGLELFEIVVIHPRQSERRREQPRRFRTEIKPPGVGGAYHRRQPQQRLRRQAELLDHHVEGAEFAAMAPEHVFDIEANGIEAFADRDDLGGGGEKKNAISIGATPDPPWPRAV